MDSRAPSPPRAGREEASARFLRLRDLPQIELHQRTQWTQATPRHVHWMFAATVVVRGVGIERTLGRTTPVTSGSIAIVNPGEAHASDVPPGERYSSRTVRLEAALLQDWLWQITGERCEGLRLKQGVVHDRALASDILFLSSLLEEPRTRLEKEHALLTVLEALHTRHGTTKPLTPPRGRERHSVRRACELLQDRYFENVSLEQLASLAAMTPFHFAKVFAREVGVPPHAFQVQVRLKRATDLLVAGRPQAEVASETGFFDQSHFCRAFKKKFGVTPGRYHR
jgi:AraC-like DNA-binding protein